MFAVKHVMNFYEILTKTYEKNFIPNQPIFPKNGKYPEHVIESQRPQKVHIQPAPTHLRN